MLFQNEQQPFPYRNWLLIVLKIKWLTAAFIQRIDFLDINLSEAISLTKCPCRVFDWPQGGFSILGEAIRSIMHDAIIIVWKLECVDFASVVLVKIVCLTWKRDIGDNFCFINEQLAFKGFSDKNAITKITLPGKIFSQSTSTYWFLSGRDCSCQNPIACIISCMIVPFWLQPLPKETSWPTSVQNTFPTADQHLRKRKNTRSGIIRDLLS